MSIRGIPYTNRFFNPKILEHLKQCSFNNKTYSWKTAGSIFADYGFPNPPKEVADAFNELAENVRAENDIYAKKISDDFDDMNYPSWVQKRKKELLPDVSDICIDKSNDEYYFVNPFIRLFSNSLFPSDWTDEFLSNKKAQGAIDEDFWKKILKDAKTKDDDYRKYMDYIYSELNGELGDEKTSQLKAAIENARTNSKNNFEALKSKYIEFNNNMKKNLDNEFKVSNIPKGATKEQIKDIKDVFDSALPNLKLHLKCNWKVDILLDEFKPRVLERFINIRLFNEFGIDPAFVKEYENWDETEQRYVQEWRTARENAILNALEEIDEVAKQAQEFIKHVEQTREELKEEHESLSTKDIDEHKRDNPRLAAKIDFLITHGRWDPRMSDEEYREELARDHTWWNLPRNP